MAAVLDALAPYVKKLIKDMAEEEVSMLFGVSGEITKLDGTMESLQDFVSDAERRRITDRSVQRWVNKLKDAMYDATDIMELCQLEADESTELGEGGNSREQNLLACCEPLLVCLQNPIVSLITCGGIEKMQNFIKRFLFCLRNPVFAHEIGNRIKELNERLEGIHKEADKYKFNIGLGSNLDTRMQMATERYSQKMTSEFNESSIVGQKIEMDTKELGQLLISNDNHHDIKVVSIVGTGGMGKTTLAQKIFNETTIQQHFKLKIWLSITQNFSEVELLQTAIEHAGGVHDGVEDKTLLIRSLAKTLCTGNFLLVLDDVWSDQPWSDVLAVPVKNASQNQHGNWVLITTRSGDMARRMGSLFYHQHHVSPLNEEDAWSLLNKQLASSPGQVTATDHLKDIGIQIIKKCGGLPIAIKVVGGLLSRRSQSERQWEAVLNHRTWTDDLAKELDKRIYLSYDDLSPQLKQCFLYCSLFPKGTIICQNDVIPMWISEGFIQTQDGSRSHDDRLEEIGAEYYMELVARNLLDAAEGRSIDRYQCKMHDVLRSFGESMARHESLVIQDKHVSGGSNDILIRRMSIGGSKSALELPMLGRQQSLRTLVINGKINFEPSGSMRGLSRLRVLSVKDADCDRLVSSLCELRHLRYFCLEGTNIARLPKDIHRMKFLQHIILRCSGKLENLPTTIVQLVHLRTLNIYDSNENVVIPKGFGRLTNLRALFGFPVHMDMDGVGRWCSLEEIGPLSMLRKLSLHGLEKVAATSLAEKSDISSKEHLDYLELNWRKSGCVRLRNESNDEQDENVAEEVLEKLCPPSCIDILLIKGYTGHCLPNWMTIPAADAFKSMRKLMLQGLSCCTQLPDGLCRLPSLEVLHIIDLPKVKRVTTTSPGFPNLRQLHLEGLCGWEEWEWVEPKPSKHVNGQTHAIAMPALQTLKISNCKLNYLPLGLASSKRLSLRELELQNLAYLTYVENFPSVVILDVIHCPKLKRIREFPMLHKIKISSCLNLEVLEGVAALDSMELQDATMETIPGYLIGVYPRYLDLGCSQKLKDSLVQQDNSELDKISHIRKHNIYILCSDEV